MTSRSARIERIQVLLEDRRHPERRVGIFSATNLTRLAIRFFAMLIAAGLVQILVGGTFLQIPLTVIAVAAADLGTARLWRRIGDQVRRGWNGLGLIVGIALMIALVLGQVAPDSALTRKVKSGATGFIERQETALDQKSRGQRLPVGSGTISGDQWELLAEGGSLVRGTFTQAASWCTQLGREWHLPPGLGSFPTLATYPDIGTIFYVWTAGGQGIQVGDGKRPVVGVSGARRPTETRAVLCVKDRP